MWMLAAVLAAGLASLRGVVSVAMGILQHGMTSPFRKKKNTQTVKKSQQGCSQLFDRGCKSMFVSWLRVVTLATGVLSV